MASMIGAYSSAKVHNLVSYLNAFAFYDVQPGHCDAVGYGRLMAIILNMLRFEHTWLFNWRASKV